MFRLSIRDKKYNSRYYYCGSFEVRPATGIYSDKDDREYWLFGTSHMAANFPHRKDAAEAVVTDSYVLVDTGKLENGEFICES